MSTLDTKLLRDLAEMKGQAVAIGAVIAAGVAMFVMFLTSLDSLSSTQASYYARNRFADVFASLKRAPLSLAARIEEIPGVSRIETRVVEQVTLDLPDLAEPAVARLVSLPERREPALNAPHLRSGRSVAPGERRCEIVASEAFVIAHQLKPGDTIAAVINDSRETLRIVGTALSPEYIAVVPPGELIPGDERFGIFWMGYDELAAAFDMEGAFNDVALDLAPDASEPEVIRRLDLLLAPYGGLGAYGRKDQLSNQFVTAELNQLRSMGTAAPIIFLGVAAFLLNVVLNRIISTQREQIGALKAFGYGRRELATHYIKLALIISGVGALVGSAAGAWLGRGLTALYAKFYHFPSFEIQIDLRTVVLAFAISSGAAVVGVMGAVTRVARLAPASAMRPEPPARYHATMLERLGMQRLLTQTTKMIMRHLERRPFKSALSSFGIALAVAILVVGTFTEDAVGYLMHFQFDIAERQDITVTFAEAHASDALREIARLPGVRRVEPFRSVAARLRFEHRSRRVGIMGVTSGADLKRLIDDKEQPVAVPPRGLMLSSALAVRLGVKPGDTLTVEVLEGSRPVRSMTVGALITEFSGLSAYMEISALNRFMREGPNVSGAYLSADPARVDALYHQLKELPGIAGVSVKQASLESFEKTMAENLGMMRVFMIAFSSIIAIGVVYNSARISLAERSRELGTLRVIGFTRAEISSILLGELAILTALAIPVGLYLGYALAAAMALGLQNDLYRIPLVIAPATYVMAATVVVVAAILSGLLVRRQLDHLNLIEVLKSKE
jgi:putative ABC transport system permease protein